MRLANAGRAMGREVNARDAQRVDAGLEELIRRAKLQAHELQLMIQRLERLRLDIYQHLSEATDR